MVAEKPAEIGGVFKSQLITDLFYAAVAESQLPLGLQHQPVMHHVRYCFADGISRNFIEPLGRESKMGRVERRLMLFSEVYFYQAPQLDDPCIMIEKIRGIGCIVFLFSFCQQQKSVEVMFDNATAAAFKLGRQLLLHEPDNERKTVCRRKTYPNGGILL